MERPSPHTATTRPRRLVEPFEQALRMAISIPIDALGRLWVEERVSRLERERDPGRDLRERFGKLRTLADIMSPLDAEREARQRKQHPNWRP